MPNGPVALLVATGRKFFADGCPPLAAAISFYTFFSLPPLLLILLFLTGTVLEPAQVQVRLLQEVEGLIGPRGAEQVGSMIELVDAPAGRGVLPTLVGVGVLLFGATAAFAQLQHALNRVWHVQQDPARGDIRNFLMKRIFSFAMILAVGFLLLVSLVVSALLAAFADVVAAYLPGISDIVVWLAHNGLMLAIITGLFAAMYKVLPDARIAWRDVGIGAFFTALLFVAGKFAIGVYLGNTDMASAYGAAGALAIVLIWVYYSSLIFLFGAEFTVVYATRHGGGVEPAGHAVRVITETKRVPPSD